MNANLQVVNIDFAEVLEIAQRGARRAYMFLGFGVNAATDPDFRAYDLTRFTYLQLVNPNLPAAQLEQSKADFRIWIEAAGLRELAESFSRFIDAVHWACLRMRQHGQAVNLDELDGRQRAFERGGIADRLRELRDDYAVHLDNEDQVLSINRARNCLAHRLGHVDHRDVDDTGVLRVFWLGCDLIYRSAAGDETVVPPEGFPFQADGGGGMLALRLSTRERGFALGTHVNLSTRDLSEICWLYSNEAVAVINRAQDYGRRHGIQIPEPARPLPHPSIGG